MEPALFDRLLPIATAEVQNAIAELPENLREAAQAIATTFESKPNAGFIADGIERAGSADRIVGLALSAS